MKALTNEKSAARKSKAAAKKTPANKVAKTSQRAPKANVDAAPVTPQTPDVAAKGKAAGKKATPSQESAQSGNENQELPPGQQD